MKNNKKGDLNNLITLLKPTCSVFLSVLKHLLCCAHLASCGHLKHILKGSSNASSHIC